MMDYQKDEIVFYFQFGFEKDSVRFPLQNLNLKSLKDLACDFVNQKFPENNFSRLNERLLLFRHDYESINVLQLINSITEIGHDVIIEIVLTNLSIGPEINIVNPHVLNVHSFEVPTFCDFCGEMLFGIVRQGLKCDGCGQNFHKRCVIKVPNNCAQSSNTNHVNHSQSNNSNNLNIVSERQRRRSTNHLQPQVHHRSPSGNSNHSNNSDIKTGIIDDNCENTKQSIKNTTTICIPHTFVKHNYTRPTVCQYCKKLLKGLFKQGFQCKDCHYNVHKNCMEFIPKDCIGEMSKDVFNVDSFNNSSNDETNSQNCLDFDDDDDKSQKDEIIKRQNGNNNDNPLLNKYSSSLTSSQSTNIPLMRIVQSVKHTRKQRTNILKEGWMVHFTNRDLISRRHFWRLDPKSIILFQNDQDTKYFKEIKLNEIVKIEAAKEKVSDIKHCFEIHTSNLIYYVGQDPVSDFIGCDNLELPSVNSGIGAYLAHSWDTTLRQVCRSLSKTNNTFTNESSEINEGEITDINKLFEILTDEILGSGQFGIVYGGVHKSTYRPVAIKVIDKLRFPTKQEAQLKNEVAILQNLSHSGIVNLERTFETSEKIFVVMEKLTGDMLEMILSQKNSRLDERITKFLITQILVALKYLHNKNIVHCDLKPENVLLNSNDEFPQIKLCDFGFARIIGEKSFRRSVVGTPAYLAPEVLRNKGYNRSLDMWSVGVVIYVSLSGTFPFNEEEDINEQIQNAAFMYPPNPWNEISNEAIDLINSLLQIKQRKRFTVDKTIQHVWLQDYQTWCDLRVLESKVGNRYLTHESDDAYWENYNSSKL